MLFVWLAPTAASAWSERSERLDRLMRHSTPEQRAHFEDHWMRRSLHLSRFQADRVREINRRSAERVQSIYDSRMDRFRRFRGIMRVRAARERELRRVLTGDQFARYQREKYEMRERMYHMRWRHDHHDHHFGPPRY